MPYLSITQPDRNTPLRMTLCLTKEECALLRPFLERAHRAAKKKYSKCWLHGGGKFFTDRQRNATIKALDQYDTLRQLHYHVDALVYK